MTVCAICCGSRAVRAAINRDLLLHRLSYQEIAGIRKVSRRAILRHCEHILEDLMEEKSVPPVTLNQTFNIQLPTGEGSPLEAATSDTPNTNGEA